MQASKAPPCGARKTLRRASVALDAYRQKRDFRTTPNRAEGRGRKPRALSFVVRNTPPVVSITTFASVNGAPELGGSEGTEPDPTEKRLMIKLRSSARVAASRRDSVRAVRLRHRDGVGSGYLGAEREPVRGYSDGVLEFELNGKAQGGWTLVPRAAETGARARELAADQGKGRVRPARGRCAHRRHRAEQCPVGPDDRSNCARPRPCLAIEQVGRCQGPREQGDAQDPRAQRRAGRSRGSGRCEARAASSDADRCSRRL